MSEQFSTAPFKETEKKRHLPPWLRLENLKRSVRVTIGGVALLAVTACNSQEGDSTLHTPEAPTATAEAQTNLEATADSFQNDAVDFAQVAMEKLPSEALASNIGAGEGTDGPVSYRISTTPSEVPNQGDSIITAMLTIEPGTGGSLEISGVEKADDGSTINSVSTLIDINPESALFSVDSDAAFGSRDYVLAVRDITPDDVREVTIGGRSAHSDIRGSFPLNDTSQFTDKTGNDIPLPDANQFGVASQAVLNEAGK